MNQRNPLFIVLGISGVFFFIFVIVAIITVAGMNSSGNKSGALFQSGGGKIGVLEVKGVITNSKKILDQLETYENDKTIEGVIVRLNSPGGAVGPSQEIYDAVKKLDKKKPVYSSMGSIAASGAYYIAVGTRKIYANPGTITGSIGVIMQFTDLSKLFEWAKVKPYNIKTGKHKNVGDPSREMPAETKALLQEMIDNVLAQFRSAVAKGRKLSVSKVRPLSDGRIFSGEQAKKAKLVDELGGMAAAVEALGKELGIKGKPKLVYKTKRKKLLERLLDDEEDGAFFDGASLGLVLSTLKHLIGQDFSGYKNNLKTELLGPLFILPNAVE